MDLIASSLGKCGLRYSLATKAKHWWKGKMIRDLSFFLCVGGEVNFEGGEQKKSRFDKEGNKVWPKYRKGRKELRIRPEGNTFFDNLNV